MSSALIAFLASLGIATWVYTKVMKSSGNQAKNALIVALVSGVINFIVLYSILSLVV